MAAWPNTVVAPGSTDCRVSNMILQLKFKWFINVYTVPLLSNLTWIIWMMEIVYCGYCISFIIFAPCSTQTIPPPQTVCMIFPELLRLEFNILHGVDHFFIYTFKEVNDVARAALLPYLSSGLATRIHFTEHPEPLIMRTRQVMNVARQSSVKLICNYMGIVQKVLDLSVVFDDLWYAKMTFGES